MDIFLQDQVIQFVYTVGIPKFRFEWNVQIRRNIVNSSDIALLTAVGA